MEYRTLVLDFVKAVEAADTCTGEPGTNQLTLTFSYEQEVKGIHYDGILSVRGVEPHPEYPHHFFLIENPKHSASNDLNFIVHYNLKNRILENLYCDYPEVDLKKSSLIGLTKTKFLENGKERYRYDHYFFTPEHVNPTPLFVVKNQIHEEDERDGIRPFNSYYFKLGGQYYVGNGDPLHDVVTGYAKQQNELLATSLKYRQGIVAEPLYFTQVFSNLFYKGYIPLTPIGNRLLFNMRFLEKEDTQAEELIIGSSVVASSRDWYETVNFVSYEAFEKAAIAQGREDILQRIKPNWRAI